MSSRLKALYDARSQSALLMVPSYLSFSRKQSSALLRKGSVSCLGWCVICLTNLSPCKIHLGDHEISTLERGMILHTLSVFRQLQASQIQIILLILAFSRWARWSPRCLICRSSDVQTDLSQINCCRTLRIRSHETLNLYPHNQFPLGVLQ